MRTLFVLLACFLLASNINTQQYSGAWSTCKRMGLYVVDYRILIGTCIFGRDYELAVVDLSHCLGSQDGKLIYQVEGKFGDICKACEMEDDSSILTCQCRNDAAKYVPAQFDINTIVGNVEGDLKC
jgi:hypothetical protein